MTRSPFQHVEGTGLARVVVYEDVARKGQLTLRWRDRNADNWRKKTLGRAVERDRRGSVTAECQAFAVGAAQKKSLELAGLLPSSDGKKVPLTVGATEALVTDAKRGLYPHDSPYRRELVRALRFAIATWGAGKQWALVTKSDWTALMRARLEQLVREKSKVGVRATEVTLQRLHTVVFWLREHDHVGETEARWPGESTKTWKQDIIDYWRGLTKSTRDPVPHRPRHTEDEARKILEATKGWYDRRFVVLMWLGIGLRPGQVVRARRSDLVLRDDGEWELTIHGAGKKGGVVIELTAGQRAKLQMALGQDGYLRSMELRYQHGEIKDYCLFPAGHFGHRGQMGRNADWDAHVAEDWPREQFKRVQAAAGVEHEPGRALYGLRRLAVDIANDEGMSPGGIENLGGWTGQKIPQEVYRDQTNRAGMREAKGTRARLLGEVTSE